MNTRFWVVGYMESVACIRRIIDNGKTFARQEDAEQRARAGAAANPGMEYFVFEAITKHEVEQITPPVRTTKLV